MSQIQQAQKRALPERIEKLDPATGEKIGDYRIASAQEVGEAIARAREAFSEWSGRTLDDRLAHLSRLREVIRDEGEELAKKISKDTGKPLVDSLMTELISIPLFISHYEKTAHQILKRRKVKTPMIFAGAKSYVEYFPMGVIGIISPWNFPFQLSMIPVISALIGGNTVVLKPSEVTPITGEVVADLFSKIEIPEGVVEVVQGDGSTGAALVGGDIDKVFFTGSVPTGRKVMEAAASHPIPVELELGGKDAMIVCEDANLRRAAKAAVWGGLINCGQVCTSVERVFVVEKIYDRFVETLREEIGRVRVGGPDENADMGPLTAPEQIETVERHIAEAVEAGAEILHGGEAIDRPGQFHEPTLLAGVTPEMSVYREETFGPVIPVIKVKDADQGVALANDHVYGLTGSVWTSDRKKGLALASRMQSGQVMINDVLSSVANPALPFGGVKSSGFGRYHGEEGLTSFMHKKAIMANKGRADMEPFWFPYEKKYQDMLEAFRLLLSGKLLKVLKPLKRLKKLGSEGADRRKG
jgi:acyl-CoA reductase-like NAD-dependent aldehyde dehydrogenase